MINSVSNWHVLDKHQDDHGGGFYKRLHLEALDIKTLTFTICRYAHL